MTRRLLIAAALAGFACDARGVVVPLDPELERMLVQPRADAYDTSPLFADRRVMRAPPRGTVHRESAAGSDLLVRGIDGAVYASTVQIPMTRALLSRGRDRFEIFCAPCHGITGDGDSVVARNMELIPPPSLLSNRVRNLPPGRIYQAIREGSGLMPSHENQLSVEDRWAVVAYVRALQRSQAVALSSLPEEMRREAEEALK